MKKNKEKTLQDRARAILENDPSSFNTIISADVNELIENLKIQQIELEMQNDELLSTQARLEISQRRYFELYDLAPVGYLTMDPKGIILEINLTAANLMDFPRGQLISENFGRFSFPDFQDIFYIHCRTVLKTREKKTAS